MLVACQQPIDERLADETRQWTETNCPKIIDEITRLDSMSYDKASKTLHYWYSVSGEADNDAFWLCYDAQRPLHKQQIADQLRVNTEMKNIVAQKRNIQYNYRSISTRKLLYALQVTPADYQ